MAKEIENININGEAYEVGKIYSKMGLSFERFVELLGRDFYCPVLASDPTTTTTTYTDTDGSGNEFQRGQFALVADAAAEGGYKVWQCLSNNGTAAVWKLWDSASGEASSSQPMVSTTWAELKAMRDGATLVPGTWYRITDYMTTTSQEGTQSAGHQFDVVVLATGTNTLSEEARAAKHEGDTYFTENGANLDAWKVWYCLDNDKLRFPWAVARLENSIVLQTDESETITLEYAGTYEHEGVAYHQWSTEFIGQTVYLLTESDNFQAGDIISVMLINDMDLVQLGELPVIEVREASEDEGYGVIYRMIDEYNNDIPYDFKNILYKRTKVSVEKFVYTFDYSYGEVSEDLSLVYALFPLTNNTIKKNSTQLNDIVFISNGNMGGISENTINAECSNITFRGDTIGVCLEEACENIETRNLQYSKIGSNCKFIDINHSDNPDGYVSYVYISSELSGTSESPLVLDIEFNKTYETKVAYNSKGELKIYCEADLIN